MTVVIKGVIVITFVEEKERVAGNTLMTLQSVWKAVMDFIAVQEKITVLVKVTLKAYPT